MVELTIKLLVGFLFVFLIITFVGKKIINQISPFTFIAAIVLSEIVGNAIYETDVGTFHLIYAMLLWGGLLFILEFIGRKTLFFRRFSDGKPSALIENGLVNREELKKNRMSLNQLQSLLRQKEVFSVREVAHCYLEANGSISVLRKSPYQNTVQEDLNLRKKPVYVPVTLIRDGEILWDEIKNLGYDEAWLKTQLKSQGMTDKYSHIFFAEWLEDDGLLVQPYE